MAHILLTGGSGFIGSHILVELIKSKHKITIIDSHINSSFENLEKIASIPEISHINKESRLDYIKGDLRDF